MVETTSVVLPELKLSSPTAFAFAARSDGATLVWSPPGAEREVYRQRLSRGGQPLGGPGLVVRGKADGGVVTDLVTTPVGEGLAVAWVERMKDESRLLAALNEGHQPTTLLDLGTAWHTQKAVRGNVAVSADRDRALVFARGRSEPCASSQDRDCFGFGLYRVGSDVSQPRGLPLSVPVPCERNSTHLSVSGGGWFYGVCTVADGKRVTTLFDIRFNPEYASAERLLPGCQPLGIVTRNAGVWLVGQCNGRRLGVKLGAAAQVPRDLGTVNLSCAGRKLELELGGAKEPLGGSRTDVLPLLPERLTRRFEQAVYTGSSLLLARGEGQTLTIERHACAPRSAAPDG